MSSFLPSRSSSGLKFTLFGVPVTISLSVVLILAFLGIQLRDPLRIALWVGIGIGAIILHELGHALVARAAGSAPEITLAGLGGVTTYRATPRARSRGWSLLISVAGPAVGIVLGLGAVAAGAPCCGVMIGGTTGEFAASVFVFVSIVWGVLNLLPILPLDGGQALEALLPGTPRQRRQRAAVVGIVVGASATAAALVVNLTFGAILAGLLTWQNVRFWQGARPATAPPAQGAAGAVDLRAARDALAAGQGDPQAAAALQRRAWAEGEFQVAAEVGEIALLRGFHHPAFAHNSACAWAQLGVVDRAVATLERALELGADREQIRRDPDLAPLHGHPAWPRLSGQTP
jgi:Zn-dependent protease